MKTFLSSGNFPCCDSFSCAFLQKLDQRKVGPPVYFWLSKLAHWSTIGRPKWTYLDKSGLAHFWLDLASKKWCGQFLAVCSWTAKSGSREIDVGPTRGIRLHNISGVLKCGPAAVLSGVTSLPRGHFFLSLILHDSAHTFWAWVTFWVCETSFGHMAINNITSSKVPVSMHVVIGVMFSINVISD